MKKQLLFKRLNQIMLSTTTALLLAVAVLSLFFHLQAQAQPVNNSTVTSSQAQTTTAITTQIRSPNIDAYITKKGSLDISGIAWGEGKEPPYLTDDPSPLIADRESKWNYYLKWTDVISADIYNLQEATQPDFGDQEPITLDDPKASYQLIKKGTDEDGTYYYRVRANHPNLEKSRWSNVISVTLPWTTDTTATSISELSTNIAAADSITVQVRIDDGSWNNVDSIMSKTWGAEWEYNWNLPEEHSTQHIIQARAQLPGGDFGPTDTITVTVDNKEHLVYFPLIFKRWPPIPYAPTLDPIDNPDQEDNYTVDWSYDHPDTDVPSPTSYTLQEAKNDSTFTTNVQEYPINDPNQTSKQITKEEDGTYYYRVRGHNEYGTGEWSAPQHTVVIVSFQDDFNDPNTGWRARRTSAPDINNMTLDYKNGRLITGSEDNYDFGVFSPMVEAPTPPYQIRMRTRLKEGVYVPSYGIVFGGNGGDFCRVERDDAKDPDGCFYHYYRLNVLVKKWQHDIEYGIKRIDEHVDRGKGDGKELESYQNIDAFAEWDEWNDWKIEVYEDRFKVYVNGHHLGTYKDSKYIDDPYFGILTSTNEWNPAKFEHEYFYVEPIN